MDNREFLKKIRKLQDSNQKISLTEMPVGSSTTNLISESKRIIKKTTLLKEEEEIQTIEPDEQREEESRFKEIVSKLVKFKPIKVHKENVEWSGYLIRERIDWYFSLDDTVGCYINTSDLIQLRDETLEVLKKLRGYYDVWSDEWSNRLTGGSAEESEAGGEMGAEAGGEMGAELGGDMGAEAGGEEGFGF